MRASRLAIAAGLFLLVPTSSALAAPDLTVVRVARRADVPARHRAEHDGLRRHAHADGDATPARTRRTARRSPSPSGCPPGSASLINNPGFGAGPTAASGPGWTCTRHDHEHLHAQRRARSRRRLPADHGHGHGRQQRRGLARQRADRRRRRRQLPRPRARTRSRRPPTPARTASPPASTVAFGPPVPAVDSGVANPERADGCSLLDVILNAPITDHAAFVTRVDDATAAFGLSARQRDRDPRRRPAVADRHRRRPPDRQRLHGRPDRAHLRRRPLGLPPADDAVHARQGRARGALRHRHALRGQPRHREVRAHRGPRRPQPHLRPPAPERALARPAGGRDGQGRGDVQPARHPDHVPRHAPAVLRGQRRHARQPRRARLHARTRRGSRRPTTTRRTRWR